MQLKKEDLIKTEKVLFEIQSKMLNGERKGWGYSELGISQTICILANEIKMIKEDYENDTRNTNK